LDKTKINSFLSQQIQIIIKKTKHKQIKMKFALIALVASATAIKLRAADVCVSQAQSDEVFHQVDTNGNGEISRQELRGAIGYYLRTHPRAAAQADHLTADDVAALKAIVYDVAGADHQLNPAEFNTLANDMCRLYESEHA
tara:strand:+ start:152 stop:574 length:423 start_codon:yes stop_codon:yes gene_type:complete